MLCDIIRIMGDPLDTSIHPLDHHRLYDHGESRYRIAAGCFFTDQFLCDIIRIIRSLLDTYPPP